MEKKTQKVKLQGVQEVEVNISLGAGKLHVEGGASDLMEAEYFDCSNSCLPEVTYKFNNTRGALTVKQGSLLNIPGGRTDWNLKFNNDIPLDMTLTCGAGDVLLRLSDLNLRTLKLKYGAGEVKVDLRGNWDHDVEAWISGGVGASKIKLSESMKIIADVSTGLGSTVVNGLDRYEGKYISKNNQESSNILTIHVKGGIGEVKLLRGE
ncbi:MAG: toast rack family protein [Caldisericia bacterium]